MTAHLAEGQPVPLLPESSPVAFRVPGLYGPSHPDLSEAVRHALESLEREYGFDEVEFPCLGGLGFRAIQAKRAGLAFHHMKFVVRLDSCSEWERQREERWPSGYEEVERDFMERYAFENADDRVIENHAVWDLVRTRGWAVCDRERHSPPPSTPLVTVAVAHFNLGQFLPETLASLAEQTYPALDVIVIDDGSTHERSRNVFEALRQRYPRFCFLSQANAGIGATRNRCLELARGEFFIPVDADNIPRPDMVERFVAAMRLNPNLDAMSCYFLAFEERPDKPIYAMRPTSGPFALSGIRNVYGDANAIFRTAVLHEIGGYERDRGTSCEDWELFVKLAQAGKRIGVVPDHLFYYRQRPSGFSRATNWFANHQRVMRQFTRPGTLEPEEVSVLWSALLGFHRRIEMLEAERRCRRYRIADGLHTVFCALARLGRRCIRSRNEAPGTRATIAATPIGPLAIESPAS